MEDEEEKYHDGMPDSYWREKSKAKEMDSIKSRLDCAANELIEELSGNEKKLAKAFLYQFTILMGDFVYEKYPNYEFKNF